MSLALADNAAERVARLAAPFLPDGIASLVGGALLSGRGAEIALIDPATGAPLLSYRDGGAEAASQAVAAAIPAQRRWEALTGAARARVLWQVGALVREQAETLAEIETRIAGKPIRDTRAETAKVAEMFEYYAGWADKIHGETIPVPTSHLNYAVPVPQGVVVQVTPWNAPLFTAGWQVAPALAAGNAVVLKPSELTPVTSLILGRLVERAGAPAGLVNVLAGLGSTAGAAAVADPRIGLVVFVGSPAAGASVAAAAARNVVPAILELGGKSANIVFADADLDRALLGAQAAIFAGAGQSCVAGSRLLVQRAVHDRFVARLSAAARRIAVGDPLSPVTEMGPIANPRQWATVDRMVRTGLAEGARVATGGERPAFAPPQSCFYAPTILTEVAPGMEIAREEVFGPVVAVTPFDTEEDALALANATAYGLAGAVWTLDVGRAHRMASRLRAGTVWVNAYRTISVMSPFGGFGRSGHGRSSGREALAAYTRTKSIWVETAEQPAAAFGHLPENNEGGLRWTAEHS